MSTTYIDCYQVGEKYHKPASSQYAAYSCIILLKRCPYFLHITLRQKWGEAFAGILHSPPRLVPLDVTCTHEFENHDDCHSAAFWKNGNFAVCVLQEKSRGIVATFVVSGDGTTLRKACTTSNENHGSSQRMCVCVITP